MARKVLKKEITDDNMLELSTKVGKMFPDELYLTLGLYTAILMADIFEDAEEIEIDDKPKVTSPDSTYVCGNHTFHIHKVSNKSYRLDYFRAGVFVATKKEFKSQEEVFKYILATLADYLF